MCDIKRYRFEAWFEFFYWGVVISAHSKQEAVQLAFKEMSIPIGAVYTIEVLPE